jgi:hypothetical protein
VLLLIALSDTLRGERRPHAPNQLRLALRQTLRLAIDRSLDATISAVGVRRDRLLDHA